ncbi:unnamed protein product [Chrysoparadoxa australica]
MGSQAAAKSYCCQSQFHLLVLFLCLPHAWSLSELFWPVISKEGLPTGQMPLFTAREGSVALSQRGRSPVTVETIGGVEGCTYLHGVLSKEECEAFIEMSETMGYTDFDQDKNTHGALSWIMRHKGGLLEEIFERCRPFLPGEVVSRDPERNPAPEKLIGLNARLRFYRYQPNACDIFRPHRDDSFPGQGLDSTGKAFLWDVFEDERASCLTWLLYLNDDFEGGHTTFFPDGGGAIKVKPVQGSVLVFPQSRTLGDVQKGDEALYEAHFMRAPLHEGSQVTDLRDGSARPKYVVRSDVLYKPAQAAVEEEVSSAKEQ